MSKLFLKDNEHSLILVKHRTLLLISFSRENVVYHALRAASPRRDETGLLVWRRLGVSTSFPGSLILPSPGVPGDGKMRDPGNKVVGVCARRINSISARVVRGRLQLSLRLQQTAAKIMKTMK